MSGLKRTCAIGIGFAILLAAGASTAMAVTVTAAGVEVRTVNYNDGTIVVGDTAADSKFVAGKWKSNYGSVGTLTNKLGQGYEIADEVVSGSEKLSQIKACRSNTFTPMTCTAYHNV